MPNVKFYVDERHFAQLRPALADAMPDIRAYLCEALKVGPAACQFAAIPVCGMDDQPQINAELFLMPNAERSRPRLTEIGEGLRARLQALSPANLPVAIRIHALDPATYIALK